MEGVGKDGAGKDGAENNGAEAEGADAGYVVVAVTDTGAGMDEATIAQAFEPFFTTKGRDGTGLGLSMVQGFAAQSGGAVAVRSVPGHGTTVELRLPAARPASVRAGPPANMVKLQGSGRILLVDDDADVRLIVGAFLKGVGFQVAVAANGAEALALVTSGEHFDLLVTDHLMPGMTGMDLIDRVRAIQPGFPALVITGFAAPGDVQVLPESVTVLRKPFQRPQLIEAVLRTLGQSAAPGAIGQDAPRDGPGRAARDGPGRAGRGSVNQTRQ
jgi:CheY-like chemotaxis protein